MQCTCTLLLLTSTLASARSILLRTQAVQVQLRCKVIEYSKQETLLQEDSWLALLVCSNNKPT